MSDDDKPVLPGGADQLLSLGPCDSEEHAGEEHVMAVKDGLPVGFTHMRRVEDGQPLPQGGDLYWTDRGGKIVDSMRLGGGDGPAQVATKQYRDNWESIFGGKKADDLPN